MLLCRAVSSIGEKHAFCSAQGKKGWRRERRRKGTAVRFCSTHRRRKRSHQSREWQRHCQQKRKYRTYGEQSYSTEHRNMDQDDPKIGTCVHYNDVIKHSLLLQMQRRAFSNSKAQLGTYQKALNLENIKL